MDSRRHVGSLLGADACLTFGHEVTTDAQPPGSEHHHHRGDHEGNAGEWTEQRGARVSHQQGGDPTDQEKGSDQRTQRDARAPGVAGEADERIRDAAQRDLLIRWSVSRDQDDRDDADREGPGQRADPAGAGQGDHHQHRYEQRCETRGEFDPGPIGQRRAPDAGSFSGGGNEEPGHQIAGDAGASGERKQDEDGSHDRHVDAGPR